MHARNTENPLLALVILIRIGQQHLEPLAILLRCEQHIGPCELVADARAPVAPVTDRPQLTLHCAFGVVVVEVDANFVNAVVAANVKAVVVAFLARVEDVVPVDRGRGEVPLLRGLKIRGLSYYSVGIEG